MKVSVVDLSTNQKKLQVEISSKKVQEELNKRYNDLSKQVRLKGFRPGKIPRKILKSYYGKSVESEVSNQFIQETFPEALRETELKPLAEADVNEMRFEDNGSFIYEATVDVCPPFEVEGYKGMEISRSPVQVTPEEVNTELENVRERHAQLRTLESDRAIREKDVVVVDFTPWVDEAVFEKGKAVDRMVEVGKKTIHPDFDEHLVGHYLNDTFSFELDYPENASTQEVAGKTVRFEVTIKEVKEKILPEPDDDFAKEVGQFETLDALKEEIAKEIEKRKEEERTMAVRRQAREQLLERVQLDLSAKVIDREVDYLVAQFQQQFKSQGLQIDPSMFDTPEIRAGYRPDAEKSLRWRLILHQIAAQENIEITEEELEQIYEEVARLLRKDVVTVKREYAESSFVEQMKENKIQDKVLKLLEAEAVYTESSDSEENTQ